MYHSYDIKLLSKKITFLFPLVRKIIKNRPRNVRAIVENKVAFFSPDTVTMYIVILFVKFVSEYLQRF